MSVGTVFLLAHPSVIEMQEQAFALPTPSNSFRGRHRRNQLLPYAIDADRLGPVAAHDARNRARNVRSMAVPGICTIGQSNILDDLGLTG